MISVINEDGLVSFISEPKEISGVVECCLTLLARW